MKKFFLFRREQVNASSVTSSDTGQGISVIGLPADSLSFITAEVGAVVMYLNGASRYEENNLTDGESFEKTSVKIPCEEGKETELIESILSFTARESGKTIMKFDAVDSESTFSNVSFDSGISAKVHINPIKRITGDVSTQTFIGSTGTVGADITDTTIAGIDFGIEGNKPELDFNHEGLSGYANNAEVGYDSSNIWANAGTGGDTYDIESNDGAPKKINGGDAKTAISKDVVRFLEADHFTVPTYTATNDYTLYVVFSYHDGANVTPIYSSANTDTVGPFVGKFKANTDGTITNVLGVSNQVDVRHKAADGAPATTKTNNTNLGTVSHEFPILGQAPDFSMHLQVFVIRRDENNNMFFYNRDGDVFAYIPPVAAPGGKVSASTDFRTDGDLVIERLGTVGDLTADTFNGNIARFGVINKDIGSASCSKLATDLFNLYKI